MKIVIDTREQSPLVFTRVETVTAGLQSGDYSIKSLEHCFAIERKSLDDLAGSLTRERERFERELHRLRGFEFARLLIVGSRRSVQEHRYRSNVTPLAILNSLAAFEARYIPVVFEPCPIEAARLIERWAFWFTREQVKRSEGIAMPEALATV